MNDIYITLTGNVASEPRQYTFEDGVRVTSLRVLTSHRYFDKKTGQWADGEKVCFAVRCWRTLADNVAQSIRVGHPVVVSGKLRIREFGAEDDRRFMAEVEASSVGHDLRWGTGQFTKPERGTSIVSRERRDRLDEDTQDWAMGRGRARPVGELVPRAGEFVPRAAGELDSGFGALDSGFGALEPGERALAGGDPFRAALPAAGGDGRVAQVEPGAGGAVLMPGKDGAVQEPGQGDAVQDATDAAGGAAGIGGAAGADREAGGRGAAEADAGPGRAPGKGGAAAEGRGRRRGRREEPQATLDDADALVRVLGAAGDDPGDPAVERAAA
ncbi:single-stranded DNA-binding protein [Nonomuraea sp. NPDC050790]|uniref:single-stranded DNA-binding protein n=1 Tax=Nonomuraea sp. NPDC050790 TaxID=3364371 RepID=UPI00379A2FD0